MKNLKYISARIDNDLPRLLLITGSAIAIIAILGAAKVLGAIFILSIPLALIFAFTVLNHPHQILFFTIGFSFFISGLSRYIKFSWGLGIDVLLVIALLVLFFKDYRKLELRHLKNEFIGLSALWMIYIVLQIVNPEAKSIQAWFYAMRGVGFYFLIVLSLTLLTFRKVKHLNQFLNMVIFLSVLGSIWAMKQKFIGVDQYEHYWLWVEGHYDEHVLFGVLRAFSFYSDAGQFGASQIMVAMMCGILLFQKDLSFKYKAFYIVGLIITFIGFALSGSRGPMVIPAFGGIVFLILSKNFKILILGSVTLILSFCILKYTHIGHGIEPVRRMRTALAPDNPSLLARKRNQQTFANHLKSRPIGGGVGSAGYWGNRFSPNTLLAETPTDSYYVKIWAETGIVGVSLHTLILGYLMGTCMIIINQLKNINLKYKAMAIFSGVFGILMASYGNQVFSQMPTGIIMAVAFGVLYLTPLYDLQLRKNISL